MTTFGERIRNLRRAKEMTLEKVAKKIGSHKGYISGIENGKVNPPSMKFVRKLSSLLGADLKTLAMSAYIDKAPKIIKNDLVKAVFGL
jgi:transcriptional regulator with XRE-family HTH domain